MYLFIYHVPVSILKRTRELLEFYAGKFSFDFDKVNQEKLVVAGNQSTLQELLDKLKANGCAAWMITEKDYKPEKGRYRTIVLRF